MRPLKVGVQLILLFLLAGSVSAQTLVRIRVEHANSREAPNSHATVLAVLNKGDTLELTGAVPYWYKVRLSDGRTAYVAKSLCEAVPSATESNAEAEAGQPASQVFKVPPIEGTRTIPDCTKKNLNVDWSICPQEGNGGVNRLANLQKNRVSIPCKYDEMTVDGVLALKNLPRNVRTLDTNDPRRAYLDTLEARAVVVEGYFAFVKRAEAEGTNCDSPSRRDLHVELVPDDTHDPKTIRNEVVITEVTPWFSAVVPTWKVADLGQFSAYKQKYNGQPHTAFKIRVYGWLFFDNWHASGSVQTYRGTAWEVHPVTRIEILKNGEWENLQ